MNPPVTRKTLALPVLRVRNVDNRKRRALAESLTATPQLRLRTSLWQMRELAQPLLRSVEDLTVGHLCLDRPPSIVIGIFTARINWLHLPINRCKHAKCNKVKHVIGSG